MSSILRIEDGDRIWRNENGEHHREDGPAVEMAHGYKLWYLYGKRHRTDGPAVEFENGDYKEWYLHGKRHRTDGPAIEFVNEDYKEWYLHGKETTQWEFTNLLVQHLSKLRLLSRVIMTGAESLVDKYVL
jgi:hypothetical protein